MSMSGSAMVLSGMECSFFFFQECTVVQTNVPSVYVSGGQGYKVEKVLQRMK